MGSLVNALASGHWLGRQRAMRIAAIALLTWHKSLMALVWIAPLFARQVAELTLIPLGLATAVIVAVIAVRRGGAQIIAIPPFTCSVCPVM